MSPTAKANCNGIAGVNGAAQKVIIAPNAVHHQLFTNIARKPVTMHGNQKIISATTNQNSISLFITCFLSHRHAFLIRCFIV